MFGDTQPLQPGIPNPITCKVCSRLEMEESRLREAYEATLKVVDKMGARLAPEHHDDMRLLADFRWQKLETAIGELRLHRKLHVTQEASRQE